MSCNGGQYETDSIYERKCLASSDRYAVILHSDQTLTVAQGSGESGTTDTLALYGVRNFVKVPMQQMLFL